MYIENKETIYNFTIRGNKFKIVIWNDFVRVFKETSELTNLIPSQLRGILNALEHKFENVSTYTELGYKLKHPIKR